MREVKAKIIKSDKRIFSCLIEKTKEVVSATALGNLLKGEESLVVGDQVYINKDDIRLEYKILRKEERKNKIFRIIVREQRKKVIAANCDVMGIVVSPSKPSYKRGLVDRYLIRASQWEIKPILIFNKIDEYKDDNFSICFEQERLKNLGVPCFEVTALKMSHRPQYLANGMEELKHQIKGKTVIFLGQSGVGKSSLINALSGGQSALKSAQIAKSGKGSHTTTWTEIISFDEFEIIDSPGVRSYSLEDIDPATLIHYFPDLHEYVQKCKFTNCLHNENSKDCGFYRESIKESEFNTLMSRLESFQRIHNEISSTPEWKKSF